MSDLEKYLKYKSKYIGLKKNMSGGARKTIKPAHVMGSRARTIELNIETSDNIVDVRRGIFEQLKQDVVDDDFGLNDVKIYFSKIADPSKAADIIIGLDGGKIGDVVGFDLDAHHIFYHHGFSLKKEKAPIVLPSAPPPPPTKNLAQDFEELYKEFIAIAAKTSKIKQLLEAGKSVPKSIVDEMKNSVDLAVGDLESHIGRMAREGKLAE